VRNGILKKAREFRSLLKNLYESSMKERLKVWYYVYSIIFLFGLFTYVILWFVYNLFANRFFATVNVEIGLEICRAVIDVDGALIGFAGLIAVYALSAMQSRLDALSARSVSPESELGKALLDKQAEIASRRSNVVRVTGLTMLLFFSSIMAALSAMSYVSDKTDPMHFYPTTAWMFYGISAIALLLYLIAKS
jgi:hypothetical protein